MATSSAEGGTLISASGQDPLPGEEACLASSEQGNIEFFNAAQQLSIGTVTTTIVSGNCTYHVSVVNNSYGSGGTPQNEGPDVPFEEIVAWLKGPKFLRIYEEALGQRLSNTGVWFIESEEFRQLVEGKDVVVWGTGMPGAGKTVISSFSLERLKEIFKGQEGVGIVGAYIRYTERPPTRAIFAGLLSQLVKDHPCAYHYMRHIYIQKDRGDLSDLDMVKAFQDIVGLLSKVFLIIDGLDEADDGVKDDLLRALPFLGANVLITSRPLELYSPRLPHALHVSIEARTEDIDHFVEEKIKSSSKLQAILRGKLALTEMLKTRIRESSRGMFLVARLQMDGVLEKGRSVSSLLKALNQLPSGVEEMYKNTLDRINAQAAEDVSIAHRVFIWLLHSARDLLAHELQDALAISFEDETYDSIDIIPVSMILSMCGGFVTVEEQGEKVIGSEYGSESHLRFIHYTTHEFLKTIELPEFASPHVYMAVACLIYLRQHTQRLQAWEKAEDPKTLRSYFASNPFLSYADQHWGKHASISQCSGPLHPLIQSYLAGCTRHELVNHKFSLASADTLGPSIRATALHLAAMYGLVNDQDKDGKTALMTACQRGHEDCVRTFMAAHGVKVNLLDQHGRSAFWYASTCDNDAIPSLLLSSCADLDVDVCDDDGNTAFAKACDSGLARTVGGILRRTQRTPTKLLSEIGGEAALAKVLENHCAGQNEKEGSEEDRTVLNTILDFLSSHESGIQEIDSEPEESDEEPPSLVVEPPDEPDIPPATVTGQDLTFEPTPPASPPYTRSPPNSLPADVLAPFTQSPPLGTPVHSINPVSLAHPRFLNLHEIVRSLEDTAAVPSNSADRVATPTSRKLSPVRTIASSVSSRPRPQPRVSTRSSSSRTAISEPRPLDLKAALQQSITVWEQDLDDLFRHAKDRFPDVVWELLGDDDEDDGNANRTYVARLIGTGNESPQGSGSFTESTLSRSQEEVWAHKAIVYARAPASFHNRYFNVGRVEGGPVDSTSSLDLNIDDFPTTNSHSEPPPSNRSISPSSPNAPSSLLRIRTAINPSLFSSQVEYLYTGKGLGDAFEFLFGSSGVEETREAKAESGRTDEDERLPEALLTNKLRKDLVYMWRARLYSDVRLGLCGHFSSQNNATSEPSTAVFSSHRFILATRCRYFRTLFLERPGKSPQTNQGKYDSELIMLPSPLFTPASLHFTLGYIYTGTLQFCNRTFDLDTAFSIYRGATYLDLTSLRDDLEARIIEDMLHGLFHASLSFSDYERILEGIWGSGGCKCRQCARRVPRVLQFSLEPDVRNPSLERGARRALVMMFGYGWCTEDFSSLDTKLIMSLLKGLKARCTPRNTLPILFSANYALRKCESLTGSWVTIVLEALQFGRKIVDEQLAKDGERCFESEEWVGIMERDSDPRSGDKEKVKWVMESLLRGVQESCVGHLYQALVKTVLLRLHPRVAFKAMLSPTSSIRLAADETRMELLKWMCTRWIDVRQARGFNELDGWALKEISDHIEVPIEDLINNEPAPSRSRTLVSEASASSTVLRSTTSLRPSASTSHGRSTPSVRSVRSTVSTRTLKGATTQTPTSASSVRTSVGSARKPTPQSGIIPSSVSSMRSAIIERSRSRERGSTEKDGLEASPESNTGGLEINPEPRKVCQAANELDSRDQWWLV
ncbi:hypothetical protein D9611_007918 [Ephemerocybe angulata]|uniref:BTB domain-containing protein n=1 Tax=Ephemerocybe angulata TaxID=980116 RepID=A0A8H5FKQ1_9AGAR|nr:hypothetical protein D9611_007918 [Tulosesus angulatus]